MKTTLLISICLGMISVSCFGQDHGHSSLDRKLAKGDTSCKGYYTNLAKEDILGRTAILFTEGGCWVEYVPSQQEFEQRYGVRYKISGCILPDRKECLVNYNKTVFDYLDSAYHGKWRKTVRKDVLGFHKRFLLFR